ncbi:MAG: hypothetical protein NTW50_04990 [Candidatus Berkelbacteria bacterium]|nr:hypothetical protein [Candidatus Berkelbacteria bacterium]
MHGKSTSKKKIEKGLDNAMTLGSINAGAKSVGLAPSTLYENISTDPETAAERKAKVSAFCVRLEPTLAKLIEALDKKVSNTDALSRKSPLRDITGAISDIRRSMETAVNILNIQVKTEVTNKSVLTSDIEKMTLEEINEELKEISTRRYQDGELKVYDFQNREVQVSRFEYLDRINEWRNRPNSILRVTKNGEN